MFMLLVGYAPTKLVQLSYVDTIQDFVCELGMKPHAHLAKIIKKIILLYHGQTYQNYAETEKIGHIFCRKSF